MKEIKFMIAAIAGMILLTANSFASGALATQETAPLAVSQTAEVAEPKSVMYECRSGVYEVEVFINDTENAIETNDFNDETTEVPPSEPGSVTMKVWTSGFAIHSDGNEPPSVRKKSGNLIVQSNDINQLTISVEVASDGKSGILAMIDAIGKPFQEDLVCREIGK
jgi:hypothetical protein